MQYSVYGDRDIFLCLFRGLHSTVRGLGYAEKLLTFTLRLYPRRDAKMPNSRHGRR
jgi:hypothetical protein